jgi:CRP/FNR family cyclic AMP-dependent transcriptional regulator
VLDALAASDPDPLVRETAAAALDGETPMDTLSTLPLMERILFLRRVPLFAELSPPDLKQIAAIATERLYSEEQIISRQDEPGDELYVIVSGEVCVKARQPNGADSEIARRHAGDVVGEMAIITREPRIASLVAASEVRVLVIGQKPFEGILRERPEISLAVMRVLCVRLKEMQR